MGSLTPVLVSTIQADPLWSTIKNLWFRGHTCVSTRRAYISEIDKILRHLHQFFDIYYPQRYLQDGEPALFVPPPEEGKPGPNLNLLMKPYPSNDISNVANKID